jgi:hypothetical protein
MWFKEKKAMAPLYKDETHRRIFATASGRPKGADKLKKLKTKGERGWIARLFGRKQSARQRQDKGNL